MLSLNIHGAINNQWDGAGTVLNDGALTGHSEEGGYTGCCKTSGQLWKPVTDTFFEVFLMFLGSFDCQLWAIFTLVLLMHRNEKIVLKIHPEKWLDFRVGSNWHFL